MKAITSNKWVLLLVVFLVLTNLSLVFFAFSNSKPVEKKDQNYLKTKLNLTDQQDILFKQKKEEYFTLMKPRWEEVNKLKDSLYLHIGDDEVSDSVINYYVGKWTATSRESDKILFRHFRELRKHCNKEQQAVFDTLVPKIVKFQSKKK
jgi:multidrug efflux pump subunit AcrB